MKQTGNIITQEEQEILEMLIRRGDTKLVIALYKLLLKKKFNSPNKKTHMIDPIIYEKYVTEEEYREHLEEQDVTADEEDKIEQLSADLHWRHKLDCANTIINQRKAAKVEDSDNE